MFASDALLTLRAGSISQRRLYESPMRGPPLIDPAQAEMWTLLLLTASSQ